MRSNSISKLTHYVLKRNRQCVYTRDTLKLCRVYYVWQYYVWQYYVWQYYGLHMQRRNVLRTVEASYIATGVIGRQSVHAGIGVGSGNRRCRTDCV